MRAEAIGGRVINIINGAVNIMVLTIVLLLITFSGYALWDSNQIHQTADKSHYTIYKPTIMDEGKTFKELQALNAEVFAWLTVYGTNIDYPVTQGQDNMKYVNTNAEGLYSLSGSIFLDADDNKDFSGFINILYGHHMAKQTMFGEIGYFADRGMFDSHLFGNLYFNGKDHGIEFFAFIHADAYDSTIFAANIKNTQRRAYLDNLLKKTLFQRDIKVTTDDRIVLLSTCSAASTNGRDILVGRITNDIYTNFFASNDTGNDRNALAAGGLPAPQARDTGWPKGIIVCLVLMPLSLSIYRIIYHKKRSRRKRARSRNTSQRKMNNYEKKITARRRDSYGGPVLDLSDRQPACHDSVCGGSGGSHFNGEAGVYQNRVSRTAQRDFYLQTDSGSGVQPHAGGQQNERLYLYRYGNG